MNKELRERRKGAQGLIVRPLASRGNFLTYQTRSPIMDGMKREKKGMPSKSKDSTGD